MKDYLAELAKKKNYADFLERLEEHESFTQWGIGVLPAYSPAPYTCELQKGKPGRFLKSTSTPGKNRQCYLMNEAEIIMCEIRYVKFLPRENQWLVYKTFFEQDEEKIIEYAFDSELESSRESRINALHLIEKKDGHVTSKHSWYWNDKYVETAYYPLQGNTLLIMEKIEDEFYTEQNYIVTRHNDNLVITDITNLPPTQVYPEKPGGP